MDWINLFMGFEGRISRRPFWLGILVLTILEIVSSLLTSRFEAERTASIVDLILTYPEFAVTAKRAHDRDIPTWVVALFFAGSVIFDLSVLAGVATEPTQATPPFVAAILLWGIFGVILLADLGFRRGSEGANRYGPDPLEGARSGH